MPDTLTPNPSEDSSSLPIEQDPKRLWGYSAAELKRAGLGSLLQPPANPDDPNLVIEPLPAYKYPQPGQPRLTDPYAPPDDENNFKRKRGGQPGNLNALRHGIYLEGKSIRNTTPLERAELFDIADLINYVKDYMRQTYEFGLTTKNLVDVTETMRSLSLAGVALTRMISIHNQFISSPLPGSIEVDKKDTIMTMVDHYKRKLAHIVDLSDLNTDPVE
jgi:hypothetical protein